MHTVHLSANCVTSVLAANWNRGRQHDAPTAHTAYTLERRWQNGYKLCYTADKDKTCCFSADDALTASVTVAVMLLPGSSSVHTLLAHSFLVLCS